MDSVSITVDREGAGAAVLRFTGAIKARGLLLRELGTAMLESIRRTFAEEGSPAGSWAPLAASTRKRYAKMGVLGGHKLLVLRGRLLGSIAAEAEGDSTVLIGTNLKYARVHQFGSADRGGAIGPQARIDGRGVQVAERIGYFSPHRMRLRVSQYPHTRLEGPQPEGKTAGIRVRLEGPRMQRREKDRLEGPAKAVKIAGHTRYQNIPARPYLVFRPEDPERLREIAQLYVTRTASDAGLEVV